MRLTVSADLPRFIQFFPTLDCTRKCAFCFTRGSVPVPEVSVKDYKEMVGVLYDSGVGEIDILGGEPTLHHDPVSLVDIPVRRGMSVFLSTNGENVELLNRLAEAFESMALSIGVSVHGEISEGLHDFIEKYNPLLKSVCAAEVAIPHPATGYVKSGKRYRLLYRDALVADDLRNIGPFHEYLKQVNTLKAHYHNIEGVYCQGFVPCEGEAIPGGIRCPAGTTKLTVLPDGAVYPCYLFIRRREFMLGNLLTVDFREIWKSPVLAFFRKFRKNSCPDLACDLHASCRGGCPAVSLMIYGDLNAPDPRCIRPQSKRSL
jgi:radical SAM protein with 4Fe4S-binding SPASM domain